MLNPQSNPENTMVKFPTIFTISIYILWDIQDLHQPFSEDMGSFSTKQGAIQGIARAAPSRKCTARRAKVVATWGQIRD